MKVTIPGKGVLQGITISDPASHRPKCHRFSRIPYALPPTGSRRWRKPEALPSSFSYGTESHPGQYTKPCSPCPQPNRFGVEAADEDCLQLNIYVPAGAPGDDGDGDSDRRGWPVFFYIRKRCITGFRGDVLLTYYFRWRFPAIRLQQLR
jgi:carboxylesterase type B